MFRQRLKAFLIVAHLILLDYFVKEVTLARQAKGLLPVQVIPDFFRFSYVKNMGCAWGMFQGHVWPLAVFAFVAMGFLVWKRKSIFPQNLMGRAVELLLHAGIVGNLIDRVFRGGVIDMFDMYWGTYHFPCFNVADVYITVSAAGLFLLSLLQKEETPKDVDDRKKDVADGRS